MNQHVTHYINNAPETQKEIMKEIRSLIHASIQDVVEDFKWNRPVYRVTKDFAYLKSAKNHVTVGFFNAENIDDPDNLLVGSGKDMKHIKLKSVDDINSEVLIRWLRAVAE